VDRELGTSVTAFTTADTVEWTPVPKDSKASRLSVRLVKVGIRFILVAACVGAAGWWIKREVLSPARGKGRILTLPRGVPWTHIRYFPQASTCIVAGFASITLLAAIRLGSRRLRNGLACRPWPVVLLCVALLALQSFETFSHGRPLWYIARDVLPRCKRTPETRYWAASSLRYIDDLGAEYEQSVPARVAILAVGCMVISLLWAARAREVALGSSVFWIWTSAYLLIQAEHPHWLWGRWDFWGELVPHC